MGIGDNLIGAGLARGAAARGKKIAFGCGINVMWDQNSEHIFRDNPNVVFPGKQWGGDVEWIEFYKGHRGYNKQGVGHWIWNLSWKCTPGEIFLSHGEKAAGERHGKGFIVIEPNVEAWKSSSPNKDWGREKYQAVATQLLSDGHAILQFTYPKGGSVLRGVKSVETRSFRDALSIMRHAKLYLGPEGGLHHGSAAVGIPGVIIFGGFIPPSVTGYESHTNLAGSDRFCGSFTRCKHCLDAMSVIGVDTVYSAVKDRLRG